jgi:hypothetical protein
VSEQNAEPSGQPAYGTPPQYGTREHGTPQYGTMPPSGLPAYGAGYEPSQAVLALVLGIIGVFVFQVVAPAAWVIGNREIQAIDAGRRNSEDRGVAVAGKILGIIGTVILALIVLFFVLVLAGVIAVGFSLIGRA